MKSLLKWHDRIEKGVADGTVVILEAREVISWEQFKKYFLR